MTDKQIGVMTTVAKGLEDNERILRFRGTSGVRDRQGDEISAKGWQTDNFMKNPVFQWAHRYDEPPIGRVTQIQHKKGALEFDVEFAPADIHPKAEQLFQLTKRGFLRGVSVGFRSLDSEWIDEEAEEEKARTKEEPDVRPGKRFKKQELLELSLVPVPCNQDALLIERQKGMDMPKELDTYLDMFDALRKSQEAVAYTRAVKERLESDNEMQVSHVTISSPDWKQFLEDFDLRDKDIAEHITDLAATIGLLREKIERLETVISKQGNPDSDSTQPAKGKAESGSSEDVATDADDNAPPDPGDADTDSEGGPEHIFTLVP